MTWKYFHGNCQSNTTPLDDMPECPPWRVFLPFSDDRKGDDDDYWKALRSLANKNERAIERGRSFRIQANAENNKLTSQGQKIVDAVNAAIHLRRPLLVTGVPGSGKTSLAYAIAYELELGPVLSWPITARANLRDALYQYDAIARLQDAQLDKTREGERIPAALMLAAQALVGQGQASALPTDEPSEALLETQSENGEEGDLGDYIQLGPVGTAFLPSLRPRVLLIDEIDKSDLNLPNDLLNLFEEGEFEIPELVRRSKRATLKKKTVNVRTSDPGIAEKPITDGRVKCCEFPLVIMTSNGERDFPPAFYRRCLRIDMPSPTPESLRPVIEAHFNRGEIQGKENEQTTRWDKVEGELASLIDKFVDKGGKASRATDQLLNVIYLMSREDSPSEAEMERLQDILLKRLSD